MFHIKTKGEGGARYASAEVEGVLTSGKDATIAAAAVATSDLDITTGLITVEDTTNGKSAVISAHNAAGTTTLSILNGDAIFSVAEATASKINVYVEAGVVKVQNNTGAEIDVNVKAYA